MAVTLENAKTSLRVDFDDDDDLIQGYISAAKGYVTDAIGDDKDGFYADPSVSARFDTAVLALTGAYYTYRASLSAISAVPIDLVTNSIIGQLRGKYDVWEGTDGD